MATFYFNKDNLIHLNFCEKVKIDLEYNKETIENATKIPKILKKLSNRLETEFVNDKEVEFILFGCLATIIGKENAVKVKSMQNPCTIFDLVDILTYIASEITKFAKRRVEKENKPETTGDEYDIDNFDIDKYLND